MGGVAPPSDNEQRILRSQACPARIHGNRDEPARTDSRRHEPCRFEPHAMIRFQARKYDDQFISTGVKQVIAVVD